MELNSSYIYPEIDYENIIKKIMEETDIIIPLDKKKINICLSGGGITSIYASGILTILYNLIQQNKISINHIYTVSGGSFLGLYFLLLINNECIEEKYKLNLSKLIYLINNTLRAQYNKEPYLALNLLETLQEYIPLNFYKTCNDKLFTSIHILDGFSIQKKMISTYYSNEHLINTIVCSSSIPYISIPTCFSIYTDPLTNKKYYALDGIYTPIIDDTNYTLYINIMNYSYPLINRMRIKDKIYDTLMLEGVYDFINFYKNNKSTNHIYYCKSTFITNYLIIYLLYIMLVQLQIIVLIFM